MNFGITLKLLMQMHGITQSELANAIGVSQRAVSKWINMQSEPTETSIYNCAKFFNVSSDYLLGLENEDGTHNTDDLFYSDGVHTIKHLRRKK